MDNDAANKEPPKGCVHIGHGVYINPSRVLAVMPIESAPVKRMQNGANHSDTLIDATYGRKTRCLLVFDASTDKSLICVASPMESETLAKRLNKD